MKKKPSYAELEQQVGELKYKALEHDRMKNEVEQIFDFSLDMIGSGNLQGYFTKTNSSFQKILGYSEEEIRQRPFIDFVHHEDVPKTMQAIANARKGRINIFIENRYKCKDGSEKWIEWKVISMPEENKFIAVGRDFTERRRAEKLIKESLIEKELLLREIHHRVKNNLEIISSLLDMSSFQSGNVDIQQLLKTIRSRVHSMALVHAQLYRSHRLAQVELDRHLQEMMDYFSLIYADAKKPIDLSLNSAQVNLPMSQAIPCALVINELITNAFNHAFKKAKKGTIRVLVDSPTDDTVLVSVKDDGDGLPQGLDLENIPGFGLKLSKLLVEGQLKGTIRFKVDQGTEIILEFKKAK